MSESDAEYFARLGRRFAAEQDELLAGRNFRSGARKRLFAGSPPSASRWSFRWAWVAAPVLVVALFVLGSYVRGGAPLTFAVAGDPGRAGELVTAGDDSGVPLRFSDGSVLELIPRARSRVLTVTANGARIELERGALQASVVHRAGTTWAVLAGPFEVAVTGTKFVTRWDPQKRELEVTVQEGSVLVSGGTLRASESVSQGRTLRVVLPAGATQAPALSVTSPSPPAMAPTVSVERLPKAQSASPTRRLEAVGSAAAGSIEPFQAVFQTGSPTDLVTLSQELRQRGDWRSATRALLALRSRFPSDPRSVLAAHTLSEMALARHDCSEARRWLQAYEARAPASSARAKLAARVQACERRP